jgi:CheY-like chemotaxis protein
MPTEPQRRILWADDDQAHLKRAISELELSGFTVQMTKNCAETLKALKTATKPFDLILLDMMMPFGPRWRRNRRYDFPGMDLADEIKRRWPAAPFACCSYITGDTFLDRWFSKHGLGCFNKSGMWQPETFVTEIHATLAGERRTSRLPKCFIVHGQAERDLLELKDFVQNNLKFGKPVILRDEPSSGRTVIEKFEHSARSVDIAFVLMTPDDNARSRRRPQVEARRARQNVVFELGFFYAHLRRTTGRVLLLHRGRLELPSDIAGVTYVDISKGVKASGEAIRTELDDWL